MSEKAVTLPAVTAAYIKTRDELSELSKKEKLLKALQEKREEWMYADLVKRGSKSDKNDFGTVFQVTKESVTVAGDGGWDHFIDWLLRPVEEALVSAGVSLEIVKDVLAKDLNLEFFERKIKKTEVLVLMGEDRAGSAPPGINYAARKTVQVNRAKEEV
jgi:hypothetical protein